MASVRRVQRLCCHVVGQTSWRPPRLSPGAIQAKSPSQQLFAAAKVGDAAGAKAALAAGADPNWKDDDFFDYTPLHMAAAGGHLQVCTILRQAGAEIDPRSESDETPLLMAARAQNSLEVCEYLLEEGANRAARTNYKRNARTAQEYLDDYYKELGVPTSCGLGSS